MYLLKVKYTFELDGVNADNLLSKRTRNFPDFPNAPSIVPDDPDAVDTCDKITTQFTPIQYSYNSQLHSSQYGEKLSHWTFEVLMVLATHSQKHALGYICICSDTLNARLPSASCSA